MDTSVGCDLYEMNRGISSDYGEIARPGISDDPSSPFVMVDRIDEE